VRQRKQASLRYRLLRCWEKKPKKKTKTRACCVGGGRLLVFNKFAKPKQKSLTNVREPTGGNEGRTRGVFCFKQNSQTSNPKTTEEKKGGKGKKKGVGVGVKKK